MASAATLPAAMLARVEGGNGWAPHTHLLELPAVRSRSALDVEALRAPLRADVARRRQSEVAQDGARRAALESRQEALLHAYEDEEERQHGANPHVDVALGALCYDFSRSSLPKARAHLPASPILPRPSTAFHDLPLPSVAPPSVTFHDLP